MEQITINLPKEIALRYNSISEEDRENIEQKLTKIINLELENVRQKSSDKLSKLMDEISIKAQARGLTPEILINILNEALDEKRQQASLKLSATMDKASDEAEANGLTPEILESILAEDE
jgi:hypothetical protein